MIKTDPQRGIIYRYWQAPEPQAVLLLVHGLGAHSGRWEELAQYFLRHNFSSYALELEGFGQTTALKGHVESFSVYYRDIRTLLEIISAENPGKKIFILGESLGGLLSFLFCCAQPKGSHGLVCLAPAFSVKMRVSLREYLKVIFSLLVNPRKQIPVNFVSSMCTRDPVCRRKLDADINEHRLASAKFVFHYFMAGRKARAWVRRMKSPVLFLIPGEDKLINPQASRKIFRRIAFADKQIIEYPEMFHSLSIEKDREIVFADILKWIKDRL